MKVYPPIRTSFFTNHMPVVLQALALPPDITVHDEAEERLPHIEYINVGDRVPVPPIISSLDVH